MRWLVGWSSTAAGAVASGSAGATGNDGETLHPVGSQLLWGDPDPLWAVGDWRPDEVRVVKADDRTRIAVLGICGATDEQLRVALFAARGGALRHLTAWPGSYTA
ncbi:asparagine synthase, partial [Streptomyces cellulosae]